MAISPTTTPAATAALFVPPLEDFAEAVEVGVAVTVWVCPPTTVVTTVADAEAVLDGVAAERAVPDVVVEAADPSLLTFATVP